MTPPRTFPLRKISVAMSGVVRYTDSVKRHRRSRRCQAEEIRDGRFARRTQGFSLVELLIVVALLLVMTTMYWGFGSRSNQGTQQKACQKNLQKIYIALEIYANDHAKQFPVAANARTSEEALDALVPRYTADTATFICPGSKDSELPAGESFLKRRISYAYYMGRRSSDATEALISDKQVDTKPKTAGQGVFSTTGKPPGNNHHKYGGNLLFCDGHLELTPARAPFSLGLTQGVVLLNPKP